MNRFRALLAFAGLVVAIAAGCGDDDSDESSDSKAQSKEPIVIGAAYAKSGFLAPIDAEPFKAFKLVIDRVNADGGVGGRKLELITEDSASSQEKAATATESLIDKGAEITVHTCNYDFGAPGANAAQEHGLLAVTLCAGSPLWGAQGIGSQAYSPGVATYYEGAVMAEFMRKKGWTKPFVLIDTSLDYSREICDGFKTYWGDKGGSIAGEASWKGGEGGDASIASQISDIKSSGADSLALCTYPPGGPVALRQIRGAGVTLPIVSDLAMNGTFWTKAVPDLGEYYVDTGGAVYGDDPDPKINEFAEEYKAEYGKALDVDYALSGATGAEMIIEALKRTDGDASGEALSEQLDKFDDEALLLETTFTPEIHIAASRPMRILEYKNGKPTYLETIEIPPGEVDLKLGK
jgi:branched-chain amino acid transport system substrate-binding protein